MAKRPTGRTRYYSAKSAGVKKKDPMVVVPYPTDPTPVGTNASGHIPPPNRNAPVQPIYWTRKKGLKR